MARWTRHRRFNEPVLRRPVEPEEYTSRDLELALRRCGALVSMGSVADCYDSRWPRRSSRPWRPSCSGPSHTDASSPIATPSSRSSTTSRSCQPAAPAHLDRQSPARHVRGQVHRKRSGSMILRNPVSTEVGQFQLPYDCVVSPGLLVVASATQPLEVWSCRPGVTSQPGAG